MSIPHFCEFLSILACWQIYVILFAVVRQARTNQVVFTRAKGVIMEKHIRLGVLVPSSNTAVEPLTQAMISSIQLPETTISVHFSRFAVTRIARDAAASAQFDIAPILAAADLLSHARVNVIGWSGTSSGWLGFEVDERMCKVVQEATGIPATTSTLALNKVLKAFDVSDLALVTPYLATMNEAIVNNYASIGVRMDYERHLGITDNVEIAQVSVEIIDGMVEDVIKAGANYVTTFCTNLQSAQLVEQWEKKYPGVLIFDTVATVIWDMLRIVHIETSEIRGWGKMFNIG